LTRVRPARSYWSGAAAWELPTAANPTPARLDLLFETREELAERGEIIVCYNLDIAQDTLICLGAALCIASARLDSAD
jgi:hypothetical protein